MNQKSRSSSPNNFLENKTTEKLYDVIEKVNKRSVVKKVVVNTKTPPKENLDESDICYIDSTRTDPLLTEKQHLVTLIYNNFQEFNQYIGTMQTFYRTGRVLSKGTYGKVILAQHKLTSHFVAIKCYTKDYF
jgi:serine/threonine protein kinase